ncbi:DUF4124 domain-containing protein [Variovorax sp. RCC_210]|uniref:DUF4124 domain-containing protein n=1 Tax=Variovorax sp. RCC_210 TaxID=3239217 RepID=UPI003525AFD5
MRKEDSRDPWIDPSQAPTAAAWERSLRPAKSSGGRMWVLMGAVAVAVVAYLAFDSWRGSTTSSTPAKRQAAPSASPDPKASYSPQNERQALPEPLSPRTQRFAKCTTPAGATTYSDRPCPSGTRAGEVSVKPDLNLADGMSDDARQASMQNNSAIAQSVVEHERRVAMNVDASTSECASLNALIASIDAAARQPQPAFEQDRLKDQRKRARDRQFALRCG